jgi:hypothetical protein
LKFTFTLMAMLFYGVFAFAENSGVSLRRLEWEAASGVVQYEVRVETREENQWRQVLRQTVRGRLYIDCELKNGDYRFCVRSFDVIGRPGGVSAWIEFSIAQAEPGVEQTLQTVKQSKPEPLVPAEDTASAPAKPEEKPAESASAQNAPPVQVQFDGSVDVSKPVWRISEGLAPFITLPIGAFNDFYTDTVFQPVGFLFSIESMPLRTKTIAFGIQLLPSWNFFTLERFDSLRSTHIVGLNAALAAQIKILRATVLNIRAGGGCVLFFSR